MGAENMETKEGVNKDVTEQTSGQETGEQSAGASTETEVQKTYDEEFVADLQNQIKQLREGQQEAIDKAVAEALKLNGMTEEEKKEYANTNRETSLAEREAAVAKRELEAEAKELLAEAGLPADTLPVILGENSEATKQNIETYKKSLDARVQEQVSAKLKGKTPEKGSGVDRDTDNVALATVAAEFAKAFE